MVVSCILGSAAFISSTGGGHMDLLGKMGLQKPREKHPAVGTSTQISLHSFPSTGIGIVFGAYHLFIWVLGPSRTDLSSSRQLKAVDMLRTMKRSLPRGAERSLLTELPRYFREVGVPQFMSRFEEHIPYFSDIELMM